MNIHHECLVLILVGLALSSRAQTVVSPHFYHNNKHRCNCASNTPCNDNGTCSPDLCEGSYIGVTCQHVDVRTVLRKSSDVPSELLDGDDLTCLKQPFNETVVYEVGRPTHFIWVYLYGSESDLMKPHLTLYKDGVIQPIQPYFLKLDTQSILIKLHQAAMYTILELSSLPEDLCSLEVSLGRNLAFPSAPSQSSVFKRLRLGSLEENTARSVDGRDRHMKEFLHRSFPYIYCSVSGGKGNQWWRTRLEHNARVNTVLIISPPNTTYWSCRMGYFVLKTFTADNALAYRYDHKSKYLDSKTEIHVAVEELIREVEVSVTVKDPNWLRCRNPPHSIVICEIYVYGEFHCRGNMYGPLCERYCPGGCRRELCDPDWGCPQGCTANWTGEWCSTNCMFKYGENCEFPCSEHCSGLGDCDTATGACLEGCSPGFYPPTCTEPCQLGTYDVDCLKSCSHCKENTTSGIRPCDRRYGTCLIACDDGYGGDLCEKINVVDDVVETAATFGVAGLFVVFLLLLCYKSLTRAAQDSTLEESKLEQVGKAKTTVDDKVGTSVDPEPISSSDSEETDSSTDSSEEVTLATALAERLKRMVYTKPSAEKAEDESPRTGKNITWERGPRGIMLKVIDSQSDN